MNSAIHIEYISRDKFREVINRRLNTNPIYLTSFSSNEEQLGDWIKNDIQNNLIPNVCYIYNNSCRFGAIEQLQPQFDKCEEGEECLLCYDEKQFKVKCKQCTFYCCDECFRHLTKRNCPVCKHPNFN